ncbi:proprotein convertase subtilisin/kexin-related [Holotrichia oblita]|uniref:Proprotein convertase subtilisin/kexin-related n=1 Tax=Holotrichia oblita TaxID=644536 RepID=A0ACB9SWF6_HOLOL|nr:proprotein convertase subtilisin/kexin-related [Holotrichia oblita]
MSLIGTWFSRHISINTARRRIPIAQKTWTRSNEEINKRYQSKVLTRYIHPTITMLYNFQVLWADPQEVKQRQKRDFREDLISELPLSRVKRMSDESKFLKKPFRPRLNRLFNDELWTQEWYLQDTRTRPDLPKLDLNVLPVYKAGITGKGVRVSILDDGIEHIHDDLKDNYDPDISWDCNEDDSDPLPRYEPTRQNSHGTRCAGEVAMKANNKKCGVGIAYDAKIGGVKILDGLVNDRIEGTALGYAQHLVDIYSASWGPNDDGQTVDGPGRLAKEAMERGVSEGRNGKGSIYVWASGNGGGFGDNCNCDGYLASPYTVSIGSASQKGEFPWYGEACASTLAVTYSSGAYQDQMIATTDLHNECTIKHTGTSASAPLAAGIIALALEVNQNLTWRDIQHLIVWTSELAPVAENPGWQLNAAGLWFNTRFGFGLMNALGFVKAASIWTSVPEWRICTVNSISPENTTITSGVPFILAIDAGLCKDEVNFLEHVEVISNIEYPIRGALEISLTSPAGTKVQILGSRKLDKSSQGFENWSFMSVMTWGEYAYGEWKITIHDKVSTSSNSGTVGEFRLILHGTKELPQHMQYGPRTYNHNYNRVHNRLNVLRNEDYDNGVYRKVYRPQPFNQREFSLNNLDFSDNEYWDTNVHYNGVY